jgi:hypothetical protein
MVGFLVLVPGTALAGIAFVRRGRIALGWVAGILSFVGFLDVCARLPLELWADLLCQGGSLSNRPAWSPAAASRSIGSCTALCHCSLPPWWQSC